MAQANAISGKKVLVQIETTPGSGTFAHDCLINLDREIDFTADSADVIIPDCDPNANPVWRQKIINSLSAGISGAGTTHTTSVSTWFTWISTGVSKNIRYRIDTTGALGGGWFSGAFKLTQFKPASSDGTANPGSASITLENDGPVTWTAAP